MLVEVSVPLDVIGTVKCDFDGNYHVEVNGHEVDTDEETYWRVIEARDAHFRSMRDLGVDVDE